MDRVAYKPLGTSAIGAEDEPECELDEAIEAHQHQHHHYYYGKYYGVPTTLAQHCGLKQLRVLLYLVAIMLFLIFVIQLATSNRDTARHLSSGVNTIRSVPQPAAARFGLQHGEAPAIEHHQSHTSTQSHSKQSAFDGGYLSSVVKERTSQSQTANSNNNESIDDFHIPISLDSERAAAGHPGAAIESPPNAWWRVDSRNNNKYIIVTNYIRAMKSFSPSASLTMTTQATTEFMYHALELCKRWDGPISIAVFGPGAEMQVAVTLIKFMRHCLPRPLSACIRDKVSWHLIYNRAHGPASSAIGYPKHHLDSEHFPLFVNQDQCPKFPGPEPDDLIRQFEHELKRVNSLTPKSYREQFQLTYPINVMRNAARLAATTKYLLASDIELYPSINLVPAFVNFMEKHDVRQEYGVEKFVFTLPIFEVKSNITAPKTKSELVARVAHGDAVFFHKYVCDACQNFPNRLDWLQTDKQGEENHESNENELVVFEKTQRDRSRDSWEPIFIGTNEDPLYDDRLTWDGRRDKMGQMYEMCLQNYYLLVLGNAFLVHAPGIKHIDKNETMKRLKYIRENNAIYDATMTRLKQQYRTSGNIGKC